MIPGLPNPWIILACVLAFIGALATGEFHGQHAQFLADNKAVADLKIEQAAALQAVTEKNAATERARDTIKDELEKQNAIHESLLASVSARNRATIHELGGLRIPAGRGAGSDSGLPGLTDAAAVPNGAVAFCLSNEAFAQRLNDAADEADHFLGLVGLAQASYTEVK